MRRLFVLVASVILLDTMFYSAITPLLPAYADDLGLSKTAAGVLSAAYPAGALLGTFPAAFVAARVGVKPTVMLGLALASVASWLNSYEYWLFCHWRDYRAFPTMTSVTVMDVLGPAIGAVVAVLTMSLVREPSRRTLNAVIVAGALTQKGS